MDATGRPTAKLGVVQNGQLEIKPEWAKTSGIALGPDTDDFTALTRRNLVAYRFDTSVPVWRERGLVIGKDLWARFVFEIVCVSGEARKCRPWWWRKLELIDSVYGLELSKAAGLRPVFDVPERNLLLPPFCLPLCDGIVEVYERICCCHRIRIPDLIDRLREILEVIPIPLPDPIPDPWPPGPFPGPRPGPDPSPIRPTSLADIAAGARTLKGSGLARNRAQESELRARIAKPLPDAATLPAERLYEDYVALASMGVHDAEAYVLARPYLLGVICSCTQRKVGEVPLQPGGRFDFCFTTSRWLLPNCHRSFAYKVKQFIQGTWVTVYDGVAGHDWFAQGTPADIRTSDWRALVCGSGPGDTPTTDGPLPFAMLEYVGSPSTHHRNFPAQTALSRLGALAVNSGTFTTGYAPDCPWGSALGLRLWVSPEMEPIARYYRLSIVAVTDSGTPTGAVTVLDTPVAWSRFVFVGGNWVTTSDVLTANPADVGGQQGLHRIPYWSGGNYWLSGQYHQVWNTTLFPQGRYLLTLELFNAAGARTKPNGAPGGDPGTAAAFQFRRWRQTDPSATDNVAFADVAHAFWIDNTPVQGDIVDFRKDGMANTDECQFISGPATTDVAVGFRAYHARGVADPANTFMRRYDLTWRRGLNGPGGSFASGTARCTFLGASGRRGEALQRQRPSSGVRLPRVGVVRAVAALTSGGRADPRSDPPFYEILAITFATTRSQRGR